MDTGRDHESVPSLRGEDSVRRGPYLPVDCTRETPESMEDFCARRTSSSCTERDEESPATEDTVDEDDEALWEEGTDTGRDHESGENPCGEGSVRRGPYLPFGDSLTERTSEVSRTERGIEDSDVGDCSTLPVGTTTVLAETPGSRRGDTTREDHDT